MSLYRTWRPKSFDDLVGQDAVVRTLRTALSSGKLAHAYLFSGPRGSGKTSAAKILARCIDCERGPTPDPDNTCDNCLAIFAGSALDVIEIDAASNRGIEDIRALRESVKFAPASMRMKVFIIDEAHMLTREGANAFLKTLEEPPPHVVFVLATTAPEALPATILSRCQRYAFRRIPIAVMIARMREIADAERIPIDDGALAAIAYRADGGLRDALTMLEQVASYAGGAVDAATVEAAFGATGRHYARALVDAILATDARAALHVVDEASDAGADMLGLVRGAIGEYRNLLVARIDADLLGRDLSLADSEAVVALAAATPQPKVVRGLRLLADALAAGRSSGNPRLELETAVLRLIVQGEDPSLEALATRVALLEAGAATPVVPAATPRTRNAGVGAAPTEPASLASAPAPPAPALVAPPLSATAVVAVPPASTATSPKPVPVPARTEPVASSVPADPLATSARAEPLEIVAPEPVREPLLESERATASAPKRANAPDGVAGLPAEPPAPAAPPAPTLQQVRSLWEQIRLRVEEQQKPMRGPLSRATVDALENGALTISVPDDLQESLLRPRLALIERAVTDAVRAPLRIVLRNRSARAAPVTARAEPAAAPAALETFAAASEDGPGGEIDLMSYARKRLGRTESS